MPSFDDLSYAGQLRRLRGLALRALEAYDIIGPRLKAIIHETNTTFRVDAADGSRYVLRIHAPSGRTAAAVQSELLWLAALCRDTDLTSPEPVPTRSGELLTIADDAGVPEPRICVLFRWIDGRFFDDSLTPVHLACVGELTARLHLHSAGFQRPDGFVRGRVDALTGAARAAMVHEMQVEHPEDAAAAIRLITENCSPEDGARAAQLISIVREIQRTVGQGSETFGLIHADLNQWHYFFKRGAVRVIDFDDCGYGHHLYDLAVTLSEVNYRPNTPALRGGLTGRLPQRTGVAH